MAVIQPRPIHIPYQCAKYGDDRALFNVIFEVVYVKHVKGLYPHFEILQDTYRVVINSPNNLTFKGQGHRDGTLLF